MKPKKIVVIGAGEFQQPLIRKANSLGFETHVFAWREGSVAREDADFFYDISIVEIDEITEICRKLQPAGILTSGSDLAVATVNEVANRLDLPSNTPESTSITTNKYRMREAFSAHNIPSPWFKYVTQSEITDLNLSDLTYPMIIKPTDRSGSRGVNKINKFDDEKIRQALQDACSVSFEKAAIIEEYIEGHEFSCESISFDGQHYPLAITRKYTTGDPHFIETGHLQPASLAREIKESIFLLTKQALDALGIEIGASHFEFRITPDQRIVPIELGARSGGDYISTDLVELSTGYDYLKMIIQCAIGEPPEFERKDFYKYSAVQFFVDRRQKDIYQRILNEHPEWIVRASSENIDRTDSVSDSSTRHGFVIFASDDASLLNYL